jgi:hypothetical protein
VPEADGAVVGDAGQSLVLGEEAGATLEVSNDFAVYLLINALCFVVALGEAGLQS